MTQNNLTPEQLADAVARIVKLDAKRHTPEPICFHVTKNGYGKRFVQLATKEEMVPLEQPDDFKDRWQACVDFYRCVPLMAQLIRQLWAECEQMREEIDRLRSIKVTAEAVMESEVIRKHRAAMEQAREASKDLVRAAKTLTKALDRKYKNKPPPCFSSPYEENEWLKEALAALDAALGGV